MAFLAVLFAFDATKFIENMCVPNYKCLDGRVWFLNGGFEELNGYLR